MRWAGRVARMDRREMRTEFWWRNLKERDHLDDLDLDGRISIKTGLKHRTRGREMD